MSVHVHVVHIVVHSHDVSDLVCYQGSKVGYLVSSPRVVVDIGTAERVTHLVRVGTTNSASLVKRCTSGKLYIS